MIVILVRNHHNEDVELMTTDVELQQTCFDFIKSLSGTSEHHHRWARRNCPRNFQPT